MKIRWALMAAVVLAAGVIAVDPALARHRNKVVHHCLDQISDGPTIYGFFFNHPPQPNGCAPPVYAYGHFVGQDPDPFIRRQLNRDPRTGYWPF